MNPWIKQFLSLTLLIVLVGCNNGSLFGPNPSQSGQTGILNLESTHEGAATFTNNLGMSITLTEAQVAWRSLEIIADGDDPECPVALDQTLVLNTAEDLLSDNQAVTHLGEFIIPLASYCRYQLTLGPGISDSSALTLKTHEEPGALPDFTLHLVGHWSRGEASGSFDVELTDPVTINDIFRANEGGEIIDHPLHFHGEETTATQTFMTSYEALFDGIDFEVQSQEELWIKLGENLSATTQQSINVD